MRFHPNLELRWLKKPDETSSWDFGLRWHTTAGIWGIYVWCLVKPEGGWDVSGILWWFNQNLDWFIAILCWYSDTPTKIDTGRVTIWEFDFTFLWFFFLNVFFSFFLLLFDFWEIAISWCKKGIRPQQHWLTVVDNRNVAFTAWKRADFPPANHWTGDWDGLGIYRPNPSKIA